MEKVYTKSIRNVALLGHSGGGKTSLAESMLYISRLTDRLGTVTDGNTVCDYDPEEIKRGYSISSAMAPMLWNGTKINILDTPGFFDFEAEARQCVRAADAAIIVVDGKSGIEVGTELAWNLATDAGIPKAFFINRFDDGEARFYKVFGAIREKYGLTVCPIQIPIIDGDTVIGFANLVEMCVYTFEKQTGEYIRSSIPDKFSDMFKEYHNMLLEAIAQTSDELMDKFFNEEPIEREEALEAIHQGIINGDIVPVFCGAAIKNWGIKTLLDTIAESFPRPIARKVEHIEDDNGDISEIPIEMDSSETSIFVFKTVADPFVGKMSFFKVMNGEVTKDMTLRNSTTGSQEKLNKIFIMRGKKQIDVDSLSCGDIGVTAKLSNTNTNDTLTTRSDAIKYKKIKFPKPYMTMAVTPKAKGDEDKISSGIARLLEEDPTIKYENNSETKQLTISGLGDIHLDIIVSKLKSRYGASVELTKPRLAYRETIKKKVDVEGKHKKQSGGSGQYGHVKITFSPGQEEGLTFTESVFGGAVPKNFFPAVEQGLRECMQKGVLAGYPVVNLAANLFDGSYHDVDSNEISFKLAAAIAYREGLPKANPVILEPVGDLKVFVPDNYVGDVMGDLNKRRGKVMGIEPNDNGTQTVLAEVPFAEMTDYVIALRAMTQGRGRFDFDFTRYEEVPASLADKIIKEAKQNEA
ncbi:MAG: elongation factor G [Ruminococcaceae bacterium]|nr:elongation factor G [Oscillospiraceae bacterium]